MVYNAKILLFGEYTVIQGSPALAIPFSGFSGRWRTNRPAEAPDLLPFVQYLTGIDFLNETLDTAGLEDFLRSGGYFDSTIPTGYGAGSSGALVAAVYDRFAHSPIKPATPEELGAVRTVLAEMESFFHGASSGADPLVSYVNRPLLFRGNEVSFADIPGDTAAGEAFFLLDTGIARQTGPLVKRYLEGCRDEVYDRRIREQLLPAVTAAIRLMLSGGPGLFDAFKTVSRAQWALMPDMIPPACRALWAASLDATGWGIKLCGAGGGGFLLGMTRGIQPRELDTGPISILPFHPAGHKI